MNGFVKLHREIEGTWIHNDDRYFKAWCTILLNVNWKPSKVRIGSKILDCDVNEALFSLDTWAKKFGKSWTKEQVRRFFKRLATQHYISTIGDTKTTRLRVLESMSCEELEHENNTQPDTKTTHDPTPIEEGRIKKEELRIKKESVKDTHTQEEILRAKLEKENLKLKEQLEELKILNEKQRKKVALKKESSKIPLGLSSFEKMEYRRKHKSWTQLDTNFNGGFKMPKEWDDNLKNEVLGQWIYLDEKKGENWGTTGTLSAQIKLINEWLKKYTVTEIIESLVDCQQRGNVTPNPKWTINRKLKEEQDEQKQQASNTKQTGDATDRFREAVANGYYDTDDSPKNASWAREMFKEDNEEPEQCFD